MLVLACGCAATFVKGPPPDRKPGQRIECTESAASPMGLDIVLGVLLSGGLGAYAYVHNEYASGADEEGHSGTDIAVTTLAFLSGVPFFVSSGVGHRRARRCREAQRG